MLEPFKQFLSDAPALWACSSDASNMPDIVHCNGLLPIEHDNQITFFISEKYSDTFLANLKVKPELAFSGTSVLTFVGYQFKGVFESLRPCTEEEVAIQTDYLERFSTLISFVGYSKTGFFNSYLHQPSLAITFTVHDIFDQTPKKGTGLSVVNK